MIVTEDAINLAERFLQVREGCRLVAYRDAVGRWTIGFGATGAGIDATTRWTQAQADADLRRRLREEFAPAVASAVRVPLNSNQAAALMSLAYNIGVGAFEHATLVVVLNTGDYVGAAKHFADFTKAHVGGRLTTLDGLMVRRAAEAKLFLEPVA